MAIGVQGFRGLLALLMTLALATTTLVSIAGPAEAQLLGEKTSTFYLVQAHPDDEAVGWQLIDDHQDAYSVFITMTHGELSKACVTAEEAIAFATKEDGTVGTPIDGPYRYEGPNSPVGQKDEGERMPLVNPWQGRGHDNCGIAKLSSWHWFLDDVATLDTGFPDFGISDSPTRDPWADNDYQGNFCPTVDQHPSPDHVVHPGNDPKGKHTTPPLWDPSLGCIDVWANGEGARVAFSLDDGGDADIRSDDPITEADVIAAVDTVRENRASWGIEVLPESGLMATAPGCDPIADGLDAHGDHEVVQNALYEHNFGMGAQYGIVCDDNTNHIGAWINDDRPVGEASPDRRYVESPGEQQPSDAAEWALLNYAHPISTVAEPVTGTTPLIQDTVNPVANSVQGPIRLNYGWITDEWNGSFDFPLRTTWKRFDDEAEKKDMLFVVSAHPDDEMNSWSMVEANLDKDTYGVFVIMTKGEGTTSCLEPDDPHSWNGSHHTEAATFVEGIEANITSAAKTGPYKYQGPGSPVRQEDKGERHPLGFPWEGQGSQACKDARVASWHWFLDDVHAKFGVGTSFQILEDPSSDDDYLGNVCGSTERADVCADVWANEHGARIAFDLGNTKAIPLEDGTWIAEEPLFTVDDVIESIQTLLAERGQWGLPDLPGAGMVSASTYYKGTGCAEDTNPDHKLIQDAVHGFDFGMGPQYGPLLCELDPYGSGSDRENQVLSPQTLVEIQYVDPVTESRAGSLLNENYGWLFPTYLYTKSAEQYFKRFD